MDGGSLRLLLSLLIAVLLYYRSGELQDKLDRYQEQLRQIEADLDEVQGERAEKFKELKTKEKERKGKFFCLVYLFHCYSSVAFLDTFEEQKDAELVCNEMY